jgi:transposase
VEGVTSIHDVSTETDVGILQKAVRLLEHENARLVQEISKLVKEIADLRGQDGSYVQLRIEALEQHLALLQKKLFGKSSERNRRSKETTEKPKRKGHGPREQKQLPLLPRRHELPAAARVCEVCGKTLVVWEGQSDLTTEVHVLRRGFFLVQHEQVKYRCPDGCSVKSAPAPRKLFPGARYSIGFALEVAIQKYLYHTPLARQVRQMRSEGLEIDTQTLWDQLNKLAIVLYPLYEKILAYVFSHTVVGADETRWRMMGDRGPEGKKTWQVWTVAVPTAVYYQIENSRSADTAAKLFTGYEGTIVCDGYDAYPALAKRRPGIVLAFCWAHVRRKYVDIADFFPEDTERILELIDELFAVERECGSGDSEEELAKRRQLRNEKSRPLVARIKKWATEVRTLPESGLAKAIRYMANHWSGLERFLDDPRIPLSNNISERANRGPVVGRKNHYGSRSRRGTEVAALLYSILETTKLAGVDAHAFLELAVEAGLDGGDIPLPHEVRAEVAERMAQHLALVAQYLAD